LNLANMKAFRYCGAVLLTHKALRSLDAKLAPPLK
jgi:hypothetical protein